jgi:hypothetical protein
MRPANRDFEMHETDFERHPPKLKKHKVKVKRKNRRGRSGDDQMPVQPHNEDR